MYKILIVLAFLLTSCTENGRVRDFGGTSTLDLPPGEKFINATWKRSELWYITRPMRDGEFPERVTFTEKSPLGIMEGTYYFQEHHKDSTREVIHWEFENN